MDVDPSNLWLLSKL